MTESILVALTVFSITAAPVAAEVPKEVVDGMYVTLAEVRANSDKTFAAFAGVGDGPISKEHFVSTDLPSDIVPSRPDRALLGKLFEQLDANRDDSLTRAEWNARINRDLQFADQNEDGRITLKELANARANMSVGDALGMVF